MLRYASSEMEFSDTERIFIRKKSSALENFQFLSNSHMQGSADNELRAFIQELFKIYDKEEKGYLLRPEFELLIAENISSNLGQQEVENLFGMVDLDSDGHIDKDELFHLYRILLKY
jgi:Ca2+-binding EF-hand superfamily protein